MKDAIAGFNGQSQLWCDNQFAVLPDVVLGFITLGKSTDVSHLASSSTVIWKPGRIDYAPSDEYSWLPTDVREVFSRSATNVVRLRRHHLFVRPVDTADFVYAGEAHLGSYGGPQDTSVVGNREARFTLNKKLPRDIWLKCGGYDGWRLDVNHQDHVLAAGDDAALDELLRQLEVNDFSHLCMTRYEEDSLTIHTNAKCAWLMYLREPADCGLYLNDPARGDDEEHFRCTCGISLEFPSSQTISHTQAAQVARHFFRSGQLPSDLEWSEG
jgi:hypothetical protein